MIHTFGRDVKAGKIEDWNIRRMEWWNDGIVEKYKHGGTENTEKHGEERFEDWNIRRME